MNNKTRETIGGYLFIGIWIIGFIIFTVYPMIRTIIFSFQKVDITTSGIVSRNVMFENFRLIITSDLPFMVAVKDFVIQVFLYIPIIIVFAFSVALMLNKKFALRGLYRAIFFLPVIIISGHLVNQLFSTGATNLTILEKYGIAEVVQNILPEWLATPVSEMFDHLIIILWLSGVQILIFISGLSKIDRSMYEAAMIDGANGWLSFWKITLPSMVPMIAVNILYTVVTLSTFATNPVMRQIKIDKDLTDRGYGYASAEALIYVIIIFVILLLFFLIYKFFTRKEANSYARPRKKK